MSKAGLLIGFLAGIAFGSARAEAKEADWEALEQQFRELPMEARRLTGPLFWLHGDESPELLETMLEKVAESGNGCFTAESRPHRDWLGDGWFRDLGVCLKKAKELDLKMWIFDERWWPSGEVGGRVPRKYGCKRMQSAVTDVEGPGSTTLDVPSEKLIAVIAGKKVEKGVQGSSLIDITGAVAEGKLKWDVPAGKWQVMRFTWEYVERRRPGTAHRGYLVDGASKEAVDWYIRTVYQPHYDRFKDDFGKTIPGYFYDEPETHGDWGTEVIPMLKERGVDWKKALVGWKFMLADEEQVAARYQYADAFAETLGRTLYGGLAKWCRERNVISMGHFMEHGGCLFSRRLCAGNLFQLQKYSDMGAIDLVYGQIYPGQRKVGLWQMAKLGSSISHVYGKADDIAMCEIFGAYKQDVTYPQMKWLTDQMQVRGLNFMIPHAFNPRAPYDRDCPPYFYNGGYEPRYPLHRVYCDYTSRLSLLLSGGRHVAPVAFLFLGQSYHVGKNIRPDEMTDALDDALFDCDWMPYDAFDETRIEGKEIALHDERYKVLVVPAAEVMPYETLAKVKTFFDAGGIVVGYGFLPSKSATLGKTSADIVTLAEAVWGPDPGPGTKACSTNRAGGRAYFLPAKPTPREVEDALREDAGIRPDVEVLEGRTDRWLHVLHRVKNGRDVFLVCNQDHVRAAKSFRFRIRAEGHPECWDAMRNEITSVPYRRVKDSVELELRLEPMESVLLVFQSEKRALPLRLGAEANPAREPIGVVRDVTPPEMIVPSAPQADARHRRLTVSPVKSDPFCGHFDLPAGLDLGESRVYLECDEPEPEAAVHVTVNGEFAGGFIGGPCRLEVSSLLKAGRNEVVIVPFAPKMVRVAIYGRSDQ